MRRIFVFLCSVFCFSVNAASMSELLIESMNASSLGYVCNHSQLNGKKYKEIAVCVEGKNLRSVELVSLWISNFQIDNPATKEHEKFVKKAKELISGSTYVLSLKTVDEQFSPNTYVYMTAFCSECKDVESATVLDDKSSFVFENLKLLSAER